MTGFAGPGVLPLNSTPSTPSLSQLKWKCRRGMRELDELLVDYLEGWYEMVENDEKEAFRALLELPDRELMDYLLTVKQPVSERFCNVVKHILGRD